MAKGRSSAGNTARCWHKWHVTVIAAALCVACGGSATSSGASGGGTGGSAGAPGGGTGGEAGQPGSCARTHDGATCLGVDAFSGESYGCSINTSTGGGAVSWAATGIVTKTTADSFTVDSCAPDANCAPKLSTYSVAAPGLTLDMRVGAIALVSYQGLDAAGPAGPSPGQILAVSVGDWGGAHNPDGDGRLYLAVSDGPEPSAYDSCSPSAASFGVALEKLACSSYGPSELPDPSTGDYALRFCTQDSPDVIVQMGATKPITIAGQPMHVRNLRSFLGGDLDANFDWAYWVSK